MKKYQVKDYGNKICSSEIPSSQIGANICTFIGLFGAKRENIKIRDVETGVEMTLDEFNKERRNGKANK